MRVLSVYVKDNTTNKFKLLIEHDKINEQMTDETILRKYMVGEQFVAILCDAWSRRCRVIQNKQDWGCRNILTPLLKTDIKEYLTENGIRIHKIREAFDELVNIQWEDDDEALSVVFTHLITDRGKFDLKNLRKISFDKGLKR
jgi:hypothetical protein